MLEVASKHAERTCPAKGPLSVLRLLESQLADLKVAGPVFAFGGGGGEVRFLGGLESFEPQQGILRPFCSEVPRLR